MIGSSSKTIRLDNAVFTALGANGVLAAAAFQSSAGGGAANASVRILYHTTSGALFYDPTATAQPPPSISPRSRRGLR